MRILLTIAWRNLWRNTRRTLLTSLTVALGLALLLFFLGLGDGGHRQMIENAVRMGSGHVVVQCEGYQQRGGIERSLTPSQMQETRHWLEAAKGHFPVQHVLNRIFGSALASSADGATGVQVIGIEPQLENVASRFSQKLAEGEFLADADGDRILVGKGVARKLEVDLGDKMVLMAQSAGGSEIQSRLFRVKGIIDTGQDEYDQVLVLMPLKASQEFFHLPGRVHQIAVLLDDERYCRPLADDGRSSLTGVEVLSWHEALPELEDFIRVDDGGNYVFHVFLFLLIAFMVLNTLLMSVLERRREFSLLDALGLSPLRRFSMIMLEAFFIACMSSLGGFVLGYSIHLYFEIYGFPMDAFNLSGATAAGVAFDPILYSYLSLDRIIQSISVVFFMTLLLALLPARRAAAKGSVQMLGGN